MRNNTTRKEQDKNKTKMDRDCTTGVEKPGRRLEHETGREWRAGAPDRLYGRIIRQAGLFDQLRSTPTTQNSTPQTAPMMPVSSEIR